MQNISLKTDVKMVINLVKFATDKKSAQARANSERGTFMGYDLDGVAINLSKVPQEYLDMFDKVEGE